MRLFIILLGLALFFSMQPALADCVADCQASTYCGGGSYECAQLQNECYRRECNSDNEPSTSGHDGSYGAIAYGEDSRAYGLADISPDKESAGKSAMGYCSKYGNDCEIVESFSNSCASIAENPEGFVGWSENEDRQKAMEEALEECNDKTGNKNCRVALTNCYGL
jgi:hypothetical protein